VTGSALGLPGLVWLVALLVGLPLLAVPRVKDPQSIPRRVLYLSAIASLWALALATAGVALWEGMSLEALSLRPLGLGPFLLWSLVTTAACLGVMVGLLGLQALAGHREPRLVAHLMPREEADREPFLLLALSAGTCEEWIFRGFILGAATAVVGNVWLALAIQAVAFGAAHAYQSPWGLLRAGLLGAILALPPILGGSLWPSAVAHLVIDVVAAFVVWPLFEERLSPPGRDEGPGPGDGSDPTDG